MSEQGILVVVSGFSGAGKGTLIKAMLERHHNYALSVSATTRAPREGEADGREYFFVTREKFEEMIREGQLIEHARYVDNYYGTPRQYVFQQMADGKDVILEIEIQGALKVKEKYPDALFLFVTTPDADTLKNRLTGRGTETEEVIASRLARAGEEAEGIGSYDYLIINDDLDEAVREAHEIIQGEHFRVSRKTAFIEVMKEDLKRFSKGE